MRLYLLSFFLIYCFLVGAQNTIQGSVTGDSGEAIDAASVVLFGSDTVTVISYTLTDEKGNFQFNSLDKIDQYWIQVKALGYKSQAKRRVQTGNGETMAHVAFVLNKSLYTLQEVVVKSQNTGISYEGDTVSYNPQKFVDGSEVSVGDLLNKLPGIEVDQNGSVKVGGKTVEKILLDGHEFFSNNTQMATKNLSADLVNKIEVLKNYTEYSQLKQYQSEQKVAINIAVNKDKLGKITGNIEGGAGIANKYTFRTSLVKLMPKVMFSFIGASNNVGEATLNFEEYLKLQGGINEVLGYEPTGGSVIVNLTEEEKNMLRPENNTYASTKNLSALNISYNPSPRLKLNSYLLYSGEKTKSEDLVKDSYSAESFTVRSQKELHNRSHVDMPSAYVNLNYKLSETATINYKGIVSGANANKKNSILEEYETHPLHTNDAKKNRGWNISQNFAFIKSFGKHVLTANLLYNNKKSLSKYKLKTDSLLLPLDLVKTEGWYYAQQNIEQHSIDALLDVSFLYYINDNYFLKFGVNPKITENSYQSNITQNTKDDLSTDHSVNDYKLRLYNYIGYVYFLKNKGLFRFKMGLASVNYTFNNDRAYKVDDKLISKIQPDIELSLFFSPRHSLKLLYKQSYTPLPASSYISNLVFTQYNSYTYNSDIRRMIYRNESYSLQYNLHDMFSNIMLYATGGLNTMYNADTYRFKQDGLTTVLSPTTSPRVKSWFANVFLNKGLGFIPFMLEVNNEYTNNTSKNYTENIENTIRSDEYEGSLSLNSRFRKRFNFDLTYEYKFGQNYSSSQFKDIQRVHTVGGKVKYNDKKKFKAYVELKYVSNQTTLSYKQLWEINTSIKYALNKKLEVEISGSNLLHINNQDWIENSFNGIYFTERYYRKIPGNISFKINYKIM